MSVLGQSESDVKDEGPRGVFPGGDAVEDLDGDAALEEVAQDDQAFEEVRGVSSNGTGSCGKPCSEACGGKRAPAAVGN